MSTRLFDLPLGSRFRYVGRPERTYVLLSRFDSGTVADAPSGAEPKAFQGLYSAAECRKEFESLVVEFVPFGQSEPVTTVTTVTSYADLRRAEKDCDREQAVTTNLGFMLALRRGGDARDEFAKSALPAAVVASWPNLDFEPLQGLTTIENCTVLAYRLADAMLRAREAS